MHPLPSAPWPRRTGRDNPHDPQSLRSRHELPSPPGSNLTELARIQCLPGLNRYARADRLNSGEFSYALQTGPDIPPRKWATTMFLSPVLARQRRASI